MSEATCRMCGLPLDALSELLGEHIPVSRADGLEVHCGSTVAPPRPTIHLPGTAGKQQFALKIVSKSPDFGWWGV